MILGLAITDNFKNINKQKQKFGYTLLTKGVSQGPLRLIQKFVVILLTSLGSDPVRPWFGTKLNKLTNMNITSQESIKNFVKSECERAISEFFYLQAEENKQNDQTGYDVIESLELDDIQVSADNHISFIFRFKPLKYEAIVFSIDFTK